MNKNALNGLFKPYELKFLETDDLMKAIGMDELEFCKIFVVERECSKSKDESCINTECDFNLINHHDDELYWKARKEFEQETIPIAKRNQQTT